ncbi:MAG TPA: TnsD family transposase [Pyrinomonadaceae bacterium]|nr:TnsD family transposase [Pyrinomonadaceae bacterium]
MGFGHFPTPYADELLYSLCARYSTRVSYSSAKSVIQELFGTTSGAATIDLPNNLCHLSAALPAGSSLTTERLINRHTILPFFSPFLPCERVMQLEGDMRSGRGQAGYMRSGIMASRIPTPTHLRFCPVCTQEDEKRIKETYWRRTHQVSGVEVCPAHEVFLEESDISRCASRQNIQFITADDAAQALTLRRLDLSDRAHQVLLQIACDVAWLLKHPILGSDLHALHNRYLKLLINRGFATYTGSIHVNALLDEFTRHYSSGLLKLLHCEFTGSVHTKTNWLLRLARPPKHAQHPLYHLLLMQFLGCTAAEFFSLSSSLSFFGEGPWPCLNPVAEHYRKAVIQKCSLSPRLRDKRPVGTFSCECGYSYARSGPDSSPEDGFRVGRMISFGQVWEAKLKGLWKDSSLSLSEVGRRLGVDPLTVRRHAARLRLLSSRPYRKSKPLNCAVRLKGTRVSMEQAEKQRASRARWLSAMRQSPKITLKALRRKYPREYAWLHQNDPEWLKKHRPHSGRRARSTSSVDWKKRDAEYAVTVKAAAVRLKNNPDRPVQVTKTAIGRAVGAVTLLRQKLHKMPLTDQVLAKVVETRVEYAIRRIRWAAECFTRDHIIARPWQLVLRANVYSLKDLPEVKSAVGAAVTLIESNLSLERKLTA